MTEIEEMSVEDQLREQLRNTQHDLVHVAEERDRAEARTAESDLDLVEYIKANQQLAQRLALAERRIAKIRAICDEVSVWHSSPQLLARQILDVLDTEGEKAAEHIERSDLP